MPFDPNAGDRLAGARIERDEPIAGRHIEDSLLLAVAPIGQAAARQLSRRGLAASAFVLAVHPQHLAGRGVERDHRAARAGGREQPAVDHQRRRLELVFRSRAEAVGLESPGDLELAEIVGSDLIERRIARVGEIAAVGRPFACGAARLAAAPRQATQKQRRSSSVASSSTVVQSIASASLRHDRRDEAAVELAFARSQDRAAAPSIRLSSPSLSRNAGLRRMAALRLTGREGLVEESARQVSALAEAPASAGDAGS